jgi:transcriptional/translational regulatory protein YebC/TACO1
MLGEAGSSLFNFQHKGIVRIPCRELQGAGIDPLDLAIEVGAEDVITDSSELDSEEDVQEGAPTSASSSRETEAMVETKPVEDKCFQFRCEPGDLKCVSDAIKARSFTISSTSLEYVPKMYIELDRRKYERALETVTLLSEQDDVMEVYDNFVLKKEDSD